MNWVEAARRGDESAFLRIFDEHRTPLFRFAFRLTGSAEAAEDIVQECFLELLRPGCSYAPERAPLRIFLFGVARNQALKRLRQEGYTKENGDEPSPALSPEAEALSGEIEEAVSRAVMRLPETQRTALVLTHFEQLPLAEAAAAMGIEVSAVKSRLQRARGNLKQCLAVFAPKQENRR